MGGKVRVIGGERKGVDRGMNVVKGESLKNNLGE